MAQRSVAAGLSQENRASIVSAILILASTVICRRRSNSPARDRAAHPLRRARGAAAGNESARVGPTVLCMVRSTTAEWKEDKGNHQDLNLSSDYRELVGIVSTWLPNDRTHRKLSRRGSSGARQ